MKTIKGMKVYILFSLALIFNLVLNGSVYATDIYGNINTNTTWDTSGSPYVLHNDVAVNSGVTLTVMPGTVIKANPDVSTAKIKFTVNGTLSADAGAGNAILFTSGKTTQAQNDWYGIVFSSTSVGSVMKNVEISYADYAITIDNLAGTQLSAESLKIHDFSSYGIYLSGSSTTVSIKNSEI
jgi:hypothetical protein